MTGPAPARVPAAGPGGRMLAGCPLARWALAHACPVAGSRSGRIAGRTGAA